jgi:lysophospholipase L1-like esterase
LNPQSAEGSHLTTTKKLAFSIIAIVSFFTLVEVGLRIWVYYFRDEYARYDTLTGIPYLVPGIHRDSTVVVNSSGFVGAEIRPRTPDLWRIVALGDSSTFGHGSPLHAYPAVLGRMLEEKATPGRQYEVVNAGIEGLDSAQTLARLEQKVLSLQPNVLLVYVGWNDLMKFDPRGQARSDSLASLSRGLDGLWFIKGMRKLIFVELRPRIDPPATGPASRTGRFSDFEPKVYISNLRRIIAEGRAAGAAPALMTMITVVRPGDSAQDLVKARVFFPY